MDVLTTGVSPRQPLMPGFNPDPSIVAHEDNFYLVTSTFEYLPGLPVYRSPDLQHWEQIGNVITRAEQADLSRTPTPGGAWAPTIRFHNGLFYVIVSLMFSGQGCRIYTAEHPAGPWSDGISVPAVDGIDPDLVWEEDGTLLVTFARMGDGIYQLAVDPSDGQALEEPRKLWSGTGLHAPEGPHVFKRGDFWYLLIAEGGTERGHGVSIARGESPRGPFLGAPTNPVLTTRSTDHPIQNVGHADSIDLPDGSSFWTVLGVRPVGFTRAFSPLGRETFIAKVDWVDGWPRPELLPLQTDASHTEQVFDFSDSGSLDYGWISDRSLPDTISSHDADAGVLVLRGSGSDLGQTGATVLARRITAHDSRLTLDLDVSNAIGGLILRHSEVHWVAIEAERIGDLTRVTARASLAGFERSWTDEIRGNSLRLEASCSRPDGHEVGVGAPMVGGDRILLSASTDEERVTLAELDGRYWSFETTESFTGRVAGVYARSGEVALHRATFECFGAQGRTAAGGAAA